MLIHIVGLPHNIMVKRHSIIERRQLELFYKANPKNAGVLNHEGFYVVDWAKGVATPDPYSPYDDDGASLYKAELEPTIQREENESIQDYADRLTQQRLEQRSIIEKMYRPDMSLKERAELFQKEIESYSGVNIGDQWLYSMKRDDGSRGYVLMRLDSGNYGNYLYISTLVRPQKLGARSRELPRYIKQDFEGKGFAGDFLSWITAMSDYRQVPVLLRVHPFIPSHLGPFSKEGFYMRKDLEGTSCEVCEYDDWLDEEDMSEEELYQQGLWDSANGTWKYGGKLRLSEISGDSMKYTCELCGNYEYAPWGPTNTREQLMDYYHQFGFQSAKPTKTKDFDFETVVGGLDYRYGNMIHVPMERPKPNLLMRLRLMKKPVIERPKTIMSYKAEYQKGTKGPCWDGYTYVGDTPYSKGSCVKNAETFEAFTIGEKATAKEVYEIASSSQLRGYQKWDYQEYDNPKNDSLLGRIMETPEWELISFNESVLREKPVNFNRYLIGNQGKHFSSNTPIVIQDGEVIDGNHRLASALTHGRDLLAYVPTNQTWWFDDADDIREWNDDLDELLRSSKQKCDCLSEWCFCGEMRAETKPSKIKRCKTCRKEGHNASQCVSENVPFSKGGFWEEYLQSPSYSSTPNKEHRDNPLRFGYQESDLFWDEWGSPYRMKKKWAKNEPYGIAESANFGYGKKGYPYDTGIVKSKPNSPIILSEIMRLGAIEDFSNNLKMAKTTSWGDLKKQLKGKSVVIGEVEYSVPTLKDAFKYLSNETILQIRVVEGEERWNDGLLIISFDYEGERWDFITTPTNATSQPYVEFPIEFKEAFGIQNNIVDAKHMKKYYPHYLRWLKLTDDANLRYCPYGNTEQLYPFDSRLPECVCPLCLKDKNTHMAETKPPKTSKGLIVYPNRMAELIRDGDKQMIVKDKPLDIAGKRYTVVTNRKGYAYIQLGAMQTLSLPKFKALKDKHLITTEERVKYFKGKRRLYAWPVKVLREFDKAYPTNAPLRPQDIAPKLKTYASEERNAEKEIVY